MPSITLAQVLPTRTGAPPSAGNNVDATGTDAFASLLHGQITADTRLEQAIDTDLLLSTQDSIEAIESIESTDSSPPFDPAQFLVSMGISPLPREAIGKEITPHDARLAGLPIADGKTTVALTDGTNSLSPALLTTEASTANVERKGAQTAEGLISTMPAEVESTAKLAGFEQKLADSLKAPVEASVPTSTTIAAPGQSSTGLHGTTRPAGTETLHLATPMKDQAWPAEFSQKVTWMATQDKQSAQITLNPPQMGPIEISLSIKNEQATAVFVAHNAEVRELLESALPRLREALADAGVTLGQADVSAESFQQARDGQGNNNRGNQTRGEAGGAIGSQGVSEPATRRGNGLVDTFA